MQPMCHERKSAEYCGKFTDAAGGPPGGQAKVSAELTPVYDHAEKLQQYQYFTSFRRAGTCLQSREPVYKPHLSARIFFLHLEIVSEGTTQFEADGERSANASNTLTILQSRAQRDLDAIIVRQLEQTEEHSSANSPQSSSMPTCSSMRC